MISLFDSHAHLCLLEEDVRPLLERAKKAGVTRIMDISVNAASFEKSLAFQESDQEVEIFLATATTPHDITSSLDPFFHIVQKAAKEKIIKAIGECGLEYHYMPHTKTWQQEIFLQYISLAVDEKLPLIVHCRDAFHDFFSIIKNFPTLKGVLHCFTGTYEDAKKLLDLGWYISFSGIITYPKSTDLQTTVKKIPLENILVETDTPYLAPNSFRGKKNEPSFIRETVEKIASLKEVSYEEVATSTFRNASILFG